jgi:hypothetical protein
LLSRLLLVLLLLVLLLLLEPLQELLHHPSHRKPLKLET